MPNSTQPIVWDGSSSESLAIIREYIGKDYYSKLAALWSQETDNNAGVSDLRPENVLFVKSIGPCLTQTSQITVDIRMTHS